MFKSSARNRVRAETFTSLTSTAIGLYEEWLLSLKCVSNKLVNSVACLIACDGCVTLFVCHKGMTFEKCTRNHLLAHQQKMQLKVQYHAHESHGPMLAPGVHRQ